MNIFKTIGKVLLSIIHYIGNILNSVLLLICGNEGKVDKAIFWTAASSITTFVLLFYTYKQIEQVSITNQSELLNRFRPVFSDPNATEIIMLLDYDFLKFSPNTSDLDTIAGLPHDFPCFVRPTNNLSKLNKILIDSTKTIYSFYEIDKFLLNPIEDLAVNVKWGAIDIDEVYMAYGYYVFSVLDNEEIKKYIDWNKENYPDEPDAQYPYVLFLYDELNKYQKR